MPYVLTCSDDMLIKLWDWDKGWACTQVFEGHSHVMQAAFNPKDTNTFASASLDRTIKVWSVGQPTPNFTLEGHEKGVNCVEYFGGGDRPYLISGADDKLVKIWDYQTKSCVQTLEGHAHNVSAVCFHPELPGDHHRIRGRHSQDMAQHDISTRKYAELRAGARVGDRRQQGFQRGVCWV